MSRASESPGSPTASCCTSGARHGDRNSAGEAENRSSTPSRRPTRRDSRSTAGPDSGPPSPRAWSPDGRTNLGRKRNRHGSTFHFTCHFGFAENARRRRIHRSRYHPRPAGAGGRRQRHQPPHPGRDAFTWGMKPESVDSGEAAIAALGRASQEERALCLVIADMQMPQHGRMRTDQGNPEKARHSAGLPVVMLSSSGQSDEAPRCRKLAISAYSDEAGATVRSVGRHFDGLLNAIITHPPRKLRLSPMRP